MDSVIFIMISSGKGWRPKEKLDHVYSFLSLHTKKDLNQDQAIEALWDTIWKMGGTSTKIVNFLGCRFKIYKKEVYYFGATRKREKGRWEVKISVMR